MASIIQLKRGTAAAWTSANTVLSAGEMGFETDTKKMKVGDGTTAWNSLSYTVTDGDITAVVAGTGLSGGSTSGSATLAIDTSVVVDKTTAQTLTNKTLTSPVLTTPSISTMTTTGDILYASAANTPARLGIGSTDQILKVSGGVPVWGTPASSIPTFTGCLVAGVTQSIAASTATAVTFTSTEVYDTDAFHSTSSNPSRITIPSGKGGYYLMYGNIVWQNGSPNTRQTLLYKNGVQLTQVFTFGEGTGYYYTQNFTTVVSATAGDYFEIYGSQASGGNLYIYGDSGAGSLPGLRFGCALIGV
jgi:hypothetical protein